MKVLMLSTDASILEPGSASAARMAEYGALVEQLGIIVCNGGAVRKEVTISGNVRAIPTNSRFKFLYVRDVVLAAKKVFSDGGTKPANRLAGLVITSQDPFETGLAGWLIARRLRAKLQLQVHTDFLSPYFGRQSLKHLIRVMLAKWLLPKADSVRVVSERIKRSLAGIVPKGNITVLPIYVGVSRAGMPSNMIREKHPQFKEIVLMVSRLEPEKNISLAIKAFAEAIKRHPKAGLVIAGSGSQEQPLKQLAHRYGVLDSVVFAGQVDDVSVWYAGADIFLNTSNYEGYGRTLIEAASAGLPIITTDVGLVGEVINSDNSAVVPVGDERALTEALDSLMSDPAARKRLGNAAHLAPGVFPSKQGMLERYKQSWQI